MTLALVLPIWSQPSLSLRSEPQAWMFHPSAELGLMVLEPAA